MSNFFSPKTQFADKEQKLASDEGIFAYHTCKHNQSLNSMDCTSQFVNYMRKNSLVVGLKQNVLSLMYFYRMLLMF